jgi:hypothetical protein
MQKEVIIGMVITIVLLLLVIIWAIFVRKEKYELTDPEMDKIVKEYNSYTLEEYLKHISSKETETLLNIKEKLDDRYYNTGEPVIENSLYDILVGHLCRRGI